MFVLIRTKQSLRFKEHVAWIGEEHESRLNRIRVRRRRGTRLKAESDYLGCHGP